MERRDETKLRDRAAIAEKAAIAREIARAAGDVEVEAKYQALNDSAVFWAWIAATRPGLTYKACVEYVERERDERTAEPDEQ